ncbi:uncharacterized protein ASPGLDRAFT_182350 [Aspergillus glaucus CBS 516.65]|uniref:Arb2 domain-containing protein n=1 Tax=Aspergillus glaucus CBS 516.65 TaxID=1160497 RepID=A0A1L9V3Z9_ASPGL|nr:hypothetical protein ASPGLDRAFT_182350 [Aspergillus glaucus CBS 516.65]OJJ78636.1 hypothetical protein ASPGLDRAFT_182350 [Aspergillus glaucus CBS 516.65]
MFVFRPKDLPPDPVYPADLKELGYFITDNDQIKKISDPEQGFQFKINRNSRWNDAQREAMNACIRTIVHSRLRDQGMTTLRLPLTASPKEPHVPIFVSSNLSTAKRIIVVFGEPIQDIGIWAYRSVGMQGINAGSAVSLAQEILHPQKKDQQQAPESNSKPQRVTSDTALILANTGQLIWHCGGQHAITHASWMALPRRSAVDPPYTMTGRNSVPENANWQEHVESVFEEVLAARGRLVREDAEIDIIGISEGGLGAIRYLASDWSSWSSYINAICLATPLHFANIDLNPYDNDNDNESEAETNNNSNPNSFTSFLLARGRAYVVSPEPRGVPVPGIEEHGCNCFASGEELNIECVMGAAWKEMVQWFEKVHADPEYCENRYDVTTVDAEGGVGPVSGVEVVHAGVDGEDDNGGVALGEV